jgi:hypothetical protein
MKQEEDSIVDKHKEETVKVEPKPVSSYLTCKEDKENNDDDLNNPNPLVVGTTVLAELDDILVQGLWRIP